MSNEKKLAEDNCIALFRVGSHLYGTNVETSDEDYEGVFIEPPEYVIGRKNIKEVNCSTNKTNERNTSEDIDCKYYTVSNFLTLAMSGNPNKVEWLFIPDEHIIVKNEKYWKMIVEAREFILSKKVKHSFSGYAISQRKKLITKKQRYEEMIEFKQALEENIDRGATKIGHLDIYYTVKHKKYDRKADKVVEISNKKIKGDYEHIKYYQTDEGADAIRVGENIYNYGMDVNQIYNNVCNEVAKYGHRTTHLKEYGYDVKFAYHLFRLQYEGRELLRDKKITFPRPEAEFLKEIRNGKYDLDYLIKESEGFDQHFDEYEEMSSLRKTPDQKKIDELQMKIYMEYWKEKGWL